MRQFWVNKRVITDFVLNMVIKVFHSIKVTISFTNILVRQKVACHKVTKLAII